MFKVWISIEEQLATCGFNWLTGQEARRVLCKACTQSTNFMQKKPMAKTTFTLDVEYDDRVTDPEALASAADRLLETVLSTPGIMDEYENPRFGEFYVMGIRQYAIYCLATSELMTETYGRFTRRDVAEQCIRDADSRIADDLVLVSILGIPDGGNCDEPDEAASEQEEASSSFSLPADPKDEYLHIDEHFECPSCKSHRIEEIMSGVVVASIVEGVGFGGYVDYGDQSNDDGVVDRYQCVNCGWTVPGVRDTEELFNWLKDPGCYKTSFDGDAEKKDNAT